MNVSERPKSEGKPDCERCGKSVDVVLIWEDPSDWSAGGDPDYIGCESCSVMVR